MDAGLGSGLLLLGGSEAGAPKGLEAALQAPFNPHLNTVVCTANILKRK